MSGRAVAEHPLFRRLCQPHLEGFVGPTAGISIHLDFTLADADAFGKAANKAERFLLALQAAKLRQALSSFSCCQAWPGLGLLSESPARWRLPGEVSPVTHCWQGINNKRQDSTMQRGKRKVPCGGSSALCKGTRASPWPPGLHVQPLWALFLLPVWWEMLDPLRNRPKATLARVTQEPGVGKEGSCVLSRSAKCGEGGGWRDLQAPLGARFPLPPSRGALVEQPEAGRGRRERASVQHCVQLVGQVVEHVADVFQDVLG